MPSAARTTSKRSTRAPAREVVPAHGVAEAWFAARGWTPHAFQREAWERFARGESGLVHVPTGSGKTYAAYLGALEGLAREPADGLAVV